MRELLAEARSILEQQRKTCDKIVAESRGYSETEEVEYQSQETRVSEIKNMIEDQKRKFPHLFEGKSVLGGGEIANTDRVTKRSRKLEKSNLSQEEQDFRAYLAYQLELPGAEKRFMQMDQDTAGGFAVLPTEMAGEWIKSKDDYVFVRRYARKFTCKNAHEFRGPELNTEAQDATWGNVELGTATTDDTMDISARSFSPKPLNHKIKISKKLVRASEMDVVSFVINHLKTKIGEAEESAYLSGNGQDRPLGIFVQSDAGVSVNRWENSYNTNAAIKGDNLYACVESMRQPYRQGARWIFSRTAMGQISRLKSGEATYLFQPSLQRGEPGMLLGYPVDVSEFCPDTFDPSLAVGALVNWSSYWIVDALDVSVQVLRELYAETHMDMIICRQETDGAMVDEQAAVIVQLGA